LEKPGGWIFGRGLLILTAQSKKIDLFL